MKLNLFILMTLLVAQETFAIPHLTNGPRIIAPDLLDWGVDQPASRADLSEPTANRINDIHSNMTQCDIVLSTSGNYHMALSELWYNMFLPQQPKMGSWLYTTSPPISLEHAKAGELSVGNWRTECAPTVAVGPKGVMIKLRAASLVQGAPEPIIQNQGNVLLVAKGNPKNIRTIADLARDDVVLVTSNPNTEPGSFGNYQQSIYNILRHSSSEQLASQLTQKIFSDGKWVSGKRIHHREVPQIIADGDADAGMMFYHLARWVQQRFPAQFDIVPLGGTIKKPAAVMGNKIGTLYVVRIGAVGAKSRALRDDLIRLLKGPQFSRILSKHGLKRPAGH